MKKEIKVITEDKFEYKEVHPFEGEVQEVASKWGAEGWRVIHVRKIKVSPLTRLLLERKYTLFDESLYSKHSDSSHKPNTNRNRLK